MSEHPQALLGALEALRERIHARDGVGAAAAMAEARRCVAEASEPGSDPRLLPLLQVCEAEARAYHQALAEQLREAGAGVRATRAYLPEHLR